MRALTRARARNAKGRYHLAGDVRATTVVSTYPDMAYLSYATRWNPLYPLWSGLTATLYSKGAVTRQPPPRDLGFGFVLRTVRQHPHLGLGLWIFGFLAYYIMFAWPWWSWWWLGPSVVQRNWLGE